MHIHLKRREWSITNSSLHVRQLSASGQGVDATLWRGVTPPGAASHADDSSAGACARGRSVTRSTGKNPGHGQHDV